VLALYDEPTATATAATVEFGLIGSELGAVIVFRTSLTDGTWLMTGAGRAHVLWGEVPGARIVDVLTTNVEEQWKAHLAALAEEGRRSALLEARIRAGLPTSAHLDPIARRSAIYRVLAGEAEPVRFVQRQALIRDLDRRLLDNPPPARRALPWLLVYATPLAALGALFVLPHTDLLPRLVARRHKIECPGHERQVAVGCNGGRADLRSVDWHAVPPPPTSQRSHVDADREAGAVAVRCTGPAGPGLAEIAARLDEVEAASEYCPAPPWEQAGSEVEKRRRRAARATYVRLSRASQADEDGPVTPQILAEFDAEVAKARRDADGFDAETADLLRDLVSHDWKADAKTHDAIAARLGRSTGQPCGQLRLLRTRVAGGQADKEPSSLVIGARFDAPSAPGPLGDYLCAAGCSLRVMPYAVRDYRVYACD
jgi:hypothetical protein